MPEVRLTLGATNLSANHAMARIGVGGDGLGIHTLPETRPAGAGVEFCLRMEEIRSAAHASVGALSLVIPVGTCEGALRASLPGHAVLLLGELLAPGLVLLCGGLVVGAHRTLNGERDNKLF